MLRLAPRTRLGALGDLEERIAAGLAIGLALQGSLGNFASGVMLIALRPFKAGDYIEAAGTAGTVTEVQVFATTLTTPDNRVVIVPNGQITSGNIVNYSAKDTRRLDLVFGIGYEDETHAEVTEGLAQGDTVVTAGVGGIRDGTKVKVVRPDDVADTGKETASNGEKK